MYQQLEFEVAVSKYEVRSHPWSTLWLLCNIDCCWVSVLNNVNYPDNVPHETSTVQELHVVTLLFAVIQKGNPCFDACTLPEECSSSVSTLLSDLCTCEQSECIHIWVIVFVRLFHVDEMSYREPKLKKLVILMSLEISINLNFIDFLKRNRKRLIIHKICTKQGGSCYDLKYSVNIYRYT